MDLNNESSAFRNTDPGIVASGFWEQLAALREEDQEWPGLRFPSISIPFRYRGREGSFTSNSQRPNQMTVHNPISRCEESMEGLQQLHNEEIDVYLKALHDLKNFTGERENHIRVAAVEALASLGERAPIKPLITALEDPFWDVRAAAVQVLGTLGTYTPVDKLTNMLKQEPDENVQETIIHALGQRIPIGELIHVLRSNENWMPRCAAAWALGEFGNSLAVKWLIATLKRDNDESVRAASASALGKSGKRSAKKAQKALSEALLDLDEEVREAALEAIGQLEGVVAEESVHTTGSQELDFYGAPTMTDPASHYHAAPERDTQPEFNDLPEQEICDLLLFQEQEEAGLLTDQHISPIWPGPSKEQIVRLLADFLRDKRGYVSQPKMLQTAGGPTLFLTCFYQHSSMLREVVLQTVGQTTPVESIIVAQEDEIIKQALDHIELLGERTWIDLLIVSMDLSHPNQQVEQKKSPMRVVVSGISGGKVHRHDTPVLDQIIAAWKTILQEPPVCQHPEDLTDVKLWYQPAPGHAL